jgi:hypothetical protein
MYMGFRDTENTAAFGWVPALAAVLGPAAELAFTRMGFFSYGSSYHTLFLPLGHLSVPDWLPALYFGAAVGICAATRFLVRVSVANHEVTD